MTHLPGEKPRVAAARVTSLTDADRALVLAAASWGQTCMRTDRNGQPEGTVRDLITSYRDRLAPDWFCRLGDALDHDAPWAASSAAPEALDALRRMHQASAKVELGRVHPSWWVRALREQSPAVQRLVTAMAPRPLREKLQAGLLLDSQDLVSERPAATEVASWVMALWTERLVGGEPERALDPPAIVVLSRLSPRAGYRLCRLAGLGKLILAGPDQGGSPRPCVRARREWLEGRLPVMQEGLRTWATRDVESSRSSQLPPRRHSARIGLLTMARLLADCEPFRLRWALQHWPYPIAKLIRSLMPPAASRPALLLEWETLILKTAWDRLNLEGRLGPAWPELRGQNGSELQ